MARITMTYLTHGKLPLWWWIKWAFDSWRTFKKNPGMKITIEQAPPRFGPLGDR